MMVNPARSARIAKARQMFEAVPPDIRQNIELAAKWARETLTNKEGAGHQLCVTAGTKGGVICSFAKPEWSGDHSGPEMNEAAEAIVISVCEYLSGL